ncbi:glucose/quinate/shikimate family membrane-bound PQQ-dependent dehydrogenase [Sphingomonas sp. BIUV-7]|uniref:Glucose/quinate/shikimate family membrane-bound PQQ-dependent dehydrogenase n=1 Tax=Sphingomonas natans TaxID=3063330 RepID=A0ABT8Y9P6_9SPHN|nr:glucose/quinate/shikimate family membrane-bound PQQ-dependent dehydrogenase [Sphingomonas sp. BIUV-7]MDO6414702.1 glucose/quinate/shikimate family membrane-bound PQQ-dependent dehydrogenase [Sphingomonas sp. BIUV-7]
MPAHPLHPSPVHGTAAHRTGLWARLSAAICLLLGIVTGVPGAWLAGLGGSPYYLILGLALAANAVLLWRGARRAYLLYAVILLATMAWALFEVGFNFWPLAPRGDILVPFGLWLLAPWVVRSFPIARRPWRMPLVGAIFASLIVVGIALAKTNDDIAGFLPTRIVGALPQTDLAAVPDDEWQAYGRTGAGDHFSPLHQITPANVGNLKVAWTFRTGDMKGPNDSLETTDEVTPLKIGDTVYLCSPHQKVFALDAATGKQKWVFDPQVKDDPTFQHLTCRGVSYHATPADARTSDGAPAPLECRQRLFLPTNDGRMFAIDATTGKPCAGFGQGGQVDLKDGMTVKHKGFYEGTSPPVVTRQMVIMAGAVIDNYSTNEPSGVVRGFDVYTGKLVWAWDSGAIDENALASATHHYTANSPNSWSISAVDEKLGLVYLPMGGPAPDIWGGNRTPEMERYGSALVALDVNTGKRVWSYQTVHHDLWDMDLPSQPSLLDLRTAKGIVPAIYVPTKSGNIFVLDRRTGKLIVGAPERPVPQGAAPGDRLSPTQPFSELTFQPKEKLTDANMWGATMFDQLACRIQFKRMRYEGPFTPPSTQATLVFPGDVGMFEWGGIAVDPYRQIAIANPIVFPFVSKLLPRGPNNPAAPNATHPSGSETGVQPMYGVPFGVQLNPFLSPLGFPCMAPPWGYMAGIDLNTHKILWKHKVGTTRDATAVPLPFKLGMPMLGGTMATAGGVTFLTATMDNYIRAFDVTSGKMLWQARLPAGGQSTPMSYAQGGKQYVVTAAGGHGSFGTKLGDYVIAYALP